MSEQAAEWQCVKAHTHAQTHTHTDTNINAHTRTTTHSLTHKRSSSRSGRDRNDIASCAHFSQSTKAMYHAPHQCAIYLAIMGFKLLLNLTEILYLSIHPSIHPFIYPIGSISFLLRQQTRNVYTVQYNV